ncbi:MAG: CD225/dispanin family protein [Muribaculaceae bacterium]|nr:CD225/dispanin family protein [Muribaculaceae bacterium]
MKFYIAVNGTHQGPFDIEQLRERGINPNTMVWNETMTGWTRAGDVPYLVDTLFCGPAVPPPPSTAPGGYQKPSQPCPSNWLVASILATIFCCLPFGIVGIVYASKVNDLYYSGRYDEAVQASSKAKTWTIVSAILGGINVLLSLLYIIFVGFAAFGDLY